jgi:hypothetical protein
MLNAEDPVHPTSVEGFRERHCIVVFRGPRVSARVPYPLATSMLYRAVGARLRATLPDEEEIVGEALSVDDHGRPRIDTGQDVTSCMS